jgi:hypothetical protein
VHCILWTDDVLQGLYKFSFRAVRGTGCGVMFATPEGKLYGGKSGSSFIGSCAEQDSVICSELRMSRHNHDPNYVPIFPVDSVAMTFKGVMRGAELHSKGGTEALPGVVFTAIMTPIDDADAPAAGLDRAKTVSSTVFIPSTSACLTASMAATPA